MVKCRNPLDRSGATTPAAAGSRRRVTRRSILDAAQRLFERDGYVATTMEAIAAEAGVALKTVYSVFATKPGLLRAVWDLVLKGDVDDVPVADRAWYREMLDEPDPGVSYGLTRPTPAWSRPAIGPLLRVIRSAAVRRSRQRRPVGADPVRLLRQPACAGGLPRRARVRCAPASTPAEATDILWTLNHPDVWLLLAYERGWTPERFESWFAAVTVDQLLAGGGSSAATEGSQ